MKKKTQSIVILAIGALGLAGVIFLLRQAAKDCIKYPLGIGSGDTGKVCEKPSVKIVQEWINKQGLTTLPVNGIFDQATSDALYAATNENWRTVNKEFLDSMKQDLKA